MPSLLSSALQALPVWRGGTQTLPLSLSHLSLFHFCRSSSLPFLHCHVFFSLLHTTTWLSGYAVAVMLGDFEFEIRSN
jgi:hypothetical protein